MALRGGSGRLTRHLRRGAAAYGVLLISLLLTALAWSYVRATVGEQNSVRFDETGQNVDATPVIQQVSGGTYRTVFPAAVASQEPVWNVGR